MDSDIIAMQEVDAFTEFWNGQFLQHHYQPYYQVRLGSKREGCLTAFKKDKFDVLKEEVISYNSISGFREAHSRIASFD